MNKHDHYAPANKNGSDTTSQPLVVFAHGKESGPWGSKIRHLADIAQTFGCQVLSPDYSDLAAPEQRIRRLLSLELPPHDKLVLVGSSMGGYVATAASRHLHPAALFLMAPAFGMPDYPEAYPVPDAGRICVVHGWSDDIVPVERGIRFAESHKATLHVLDADHRLNSVLPKLGRLFADFLDTTLDSRND
jgi:pimeloyl-ACP methyl ester carboxylesterase